MTPLIIGVAPNGARRTKADHPALPLSPAEIATTAAACREAGAALLHLHVRDRDGGHTLDPGTYGEAIAAVRRAVGEDLIIQVTSESVGRYTAAEQMVAVRALRPEAVSLALREIIPDEVGEADAAGFLAWLERERVLAQYILFAPEEMERYDDLCRRGVIPGAHHAVLFVLGRYSGDGQSVPTDLLPFLATTSGLSPPPGTWTVCAFGAREGACALAAATLGGHVRVGFENNLHLADGSLATDNAALVDQVRRGAELIGRPVATAAQARETLSAG